MARNKVSQNNNLKRRSNVRNFFSNFSLKKSSLRRKLIPPTEKDSVETEPIEDSLTTAICYQNRNLANEENHKTQKVVLECSKEENCGSHQLNHDKENESLSQSESVANDVNDRSSSFGGGLLHIGNNVKVLKGMYVNQYGIVSRLTKKQAYIILNENKKVVRLNRDNLQILYSINDHERGNISNTLQDRQINECAYFRNGTKVIVVDGKYRGRKGVIVHLTAKKAHIQLEKENGKESIRPCLFQNSLRIDGDPSVSNEMHIDKDRVDSPRLVQENMNIGDTVCIHHGKYASQSGTIVKKCDKTFKVLIGGMERKVKHDFVGTDKPIISDDFRIPDSHMGSLNFGKLFIRKFDASYELEKTFLNHYLGNRSRVVDINIGSFSDENQIPISIEEKDGTSYELLCHKLVHPNEGWQKYRKKNILRLTYLLTKGNNLSPVSPIDIFERLGDFASLSLRKQVARIQLLSSPAHKFNNGEYFKICRSSYFSDIVDKGHVGCGFICEKFLADILGNSRATSVQVRLVIPSMGIYKGMLMRKKVDSDGPKVLLPSSMKKVPASKHPDRSMNAYLSICQAGVDPSQTSSQIESIMNGGEASNSFHPKILGDMITRLLLAWGVPKDVLETYSRSVTKSSRNNLTRLSHAYLRGVADPTGEIPAYSCFITGLNNDNSTLNRTDFVFITRSPCIRASDGKKIKVMTTKPSSMSDESYNSLRSLPFGLIIFGFPPDKMKAIPELIAEGDLDGDRFFICWDIEILKHLKAEFVTHSMISNIDFIKKDTCDDGCEIHENSDQNWFQKIQHHLVHEDCCLIERLIAKLYSLSEKEAVADEKNGIRNKNAEAYAKAYIQALENGKHGTKIELPHELHHMIPISLRKYLLVASEK